MAEEDDLNEDNPANKNLNDNEDPPEDNPSEEPSDNPNDEEEDPGPTEYFSISDVDALDAKREFNEKNNYQEASLSDLRSDASEDNKIVPPVTRVTENYLLKQLNDLSKLDEATCSRSIEIGIKGVARKMGVSVDLEHYKGNYRLLIDRLKIRLN